MRKQRTDAQSASRVTWEHLEEWVRRKVQAFLQAILEEEVTECLGRRKSQRRQAVDADCRAHHTRTHRATRSRSQIDTTPVEVRPGLRRVHVSACDVVSRKGVVAAHDRGSSRAAERVLREAFPRFGFPVRAIQIDGGSEFKAVFEAACERMGIRLFVPPPRSPKLNGHVERAHRTHQEEFYDLVEVPDALAEHNAMLQAWEQVYNTIRPHQALNYSTPNEYVTAWQRQR